MIPTHLCIVYKRHLKHTIVYVDGSKGMGRRIKDACGLSLLPLHCGYTNMLEKPGLVNNLVLTLCHFLSGLVKISPQVLFTTNMVQSQEETKVRIGTQGVSFNGTRGWNPSTLPPCLSTVIPFEGRLPLGKKGAV